MQRRHVWQNNAMQHSATPTHAYSNIWLGLAKMRLQLGSQLALDRLSSRVVSLICSLNPVASPGSFHVVLHAGGGLLRGMGGDEPSGGGRLCPAEPTVPAPGPLLFRCPHHRGSHQMETQVCQGKLSPCWAPLHCLHLLGMLHWLLL